MNKFMDAMGGIQPSEELRERTLGQCATEDEQTLSTFDFQTSTPTLTPRPTLHTPHSRKRIGKRFYRFAALATAVALVFTGVITGAVVTRLGRDRTDVKAFKSINDVKKYVNSKVSQNQRSSLFDFNSGMRKASPTEDAAAPDAAYKGPGGSSGYSTTNNQVEGVSESDIVHTDGEYIYALSYNRLTIAYLGDFSVKVKIEYDNFFPSEMFLVPGDNGEDKGRLVILGNKYENKYAVNHNAPDVAAYYWYANTEIVRVYDLNTLMVYYSVDPGPRLEPVPEIPDPITRELVFPNCYRSAARMIGQKLYLMYNAGNTYMTDETGGRDVWIPEYADGEAGAEPKPLPAKNICSSPDNGREYSFMILAAADLSDNESEAEVKAYFGSAGTVYATTNAFYISFRRYPYNSSLFSRRTAGAAYGLRIMRFKIDGAGLIYNGAGAVRGFPPPQGQFGFDEHEYPDGVYLRAATTYGGESFMTVFNDKMKIVGELDGIGEKGESLYSVRFRGTQAVAVTFRQTDPFYVIDLSDPRKPFIVDELKIPGVSDYLHYLKVNTNLVFGVGRDSNDKGQLGGVKVSLFDISKSPIGEKKIIPGLGGGQASSEATYNHKAIMYFMPYAGVAEIPVEEKLEIFAFPVSNYNYTWSANYEYCDYKWDSALLYYTVNAEGELTQDIIRYSPVEFKVKNSDYYSGRYHEDVIRRGVISDGYLYLVGNFSIERYGLDGETFLPDTGTREVLKIGSF